MSAFDEMQGHEIAELVRGLLDDETARPLLSLVAEIDARIIGHVLFTAAKLQPEVQSVSTQLLAPLAVSKEHQRKGVGGALIKEGLRQLATSGIGLVFVLGHPSYYPKFGFRPAGALGFDAPYPIPSAHQNAWMVQELQAGMIGRVRGKVQCAQILDQPQHWQE